MRAGRWLLAAFVVAGLPACAETSKPVPVKVEKKDGRWRLMREGKPYVIRGAGATDRLDLLRAYGGNSTRTWGADAGRRILDEAHALGMTATVGIWLGHIEHGFDYNDAEQVKRQYEEARQWVLSLRDHPALLMWCLGNEMEVWDNDTPVLWRAVNDLARMVKELDPHHPVMTIVAEIDAGKIRNIQTHAPDVDILGVNAYGGMPTVARRLKEMGWTKAYVATEFGPQGPWERPKSKWDAPLEPTSTEKALQYRLSFEKGVAPHKDICLGSYAFLWGDKWEATTTWFGMLLPTGETTESVDVMSRAWTGKWPKNRAPRIVEWNADPQLVKPGEPVKAAVKAEDPEKDPLTYQWEIRPDGEPNAKIIPGLVDDLKTGTVSFPAPTTPGRYRLYVTVRDGKGHAATANVPFMVEPAE